MESSTDHVPQTSWPVDISSSHVFWNSSLGFLECILLVFFPAQRAPGKYGGMVEPNIATKVYILIRDRGLGSLSCAQEKIWDISTWYKPISPMPHPSVLPNCATKSKWWCPVARRWFFLTWFQFCSLRQVKFSQGTVSGRGFRFVIQSISIA